MKTNTLNPCGLFLSGMLIVLLVFRASAAVYTVTSTADSGAGSLREAILMANTNAGTDTINFSVAGPIILANSLPTIFNSIIIEGGGTPNTLTNDDNATFTVELTTTNSGVSGFLIAGGNSTVRGLVMNGFTTCIQLSYSGGNTIIGNILGLSPDGINPSPRVTGTAILVATTNGVNYIGGSSPAARNIISGNGHGISITSPLPGLGVNYIEGNFIGTDRHGTLAIPNTSEGISIQSKSNRVGGASIAQRNLISGNGVALQITGAFNLVQGNYIGTDITGTNALPNSNPFPISVGQAGTGGTNQVGGPTGVPGTPPGNLISGNAGALSLAGTGQIVQGNIIGLDATGTNRMPNNGSAGLIAGGPAATIGGVMPGDGNVISGNQNAGVLIQGNNALVQGNWIGTDVSGTLNLSNGTHGVWISQARNCTVGGAAPNVIAFNGGIGVYVHTSSAISNLISANMIYSNGGLGLDLSEVNSPGLTLNDPCDADTLGGNQLQNYPVITNVVTGAGTTTIKGYMPGAANSGYRLEFFANDACDASGYGEGRNYLGYEDIAASANCTNAFSVTIPVGSLGGKFITATATDTNNNTSEFSQCLTAIGTSAVPTVTIVPAGAGQVGISWSPNSAGWVLQETWLLSPSNWTNSPSGATNPIVVPATVPAKFYRLFKP